MGDGLQLLSCTAFWVAVVQLSYGLQTSPLYNYHSKLSMPSAVKPTKNQLRRAKKKAAKQQDVSVHYPDMSILLTFI